MQITPRVEISRIFFPDTRRRFQLEWPNYHWNRSIAHFPVVGVINF